MKKKLKSCCVLIIVIVGLLSVGSCEYDGTDWTTPEPERISAPPAFRLSIPATMFSDNTGKIVTLYCLAGSNCRQVPSFVRENRDAFQDTQQLYNCTERFGSLAMQAMLSSPPPSEIREGVFKVAGSDPTLLSHADKVSSDMSSSLADLVTLSHYMQQLTAAVPSMLQGNDRPYYGIEMVQIMSIADPYMLNEYRAFMFNCSYPQIYTMVKMACN
jgi:hypothetical protein